MPDGQTLPLGDEIHHYWLALAMAKAAGVDLAAAMADGRLTESDWAETVTRCRGCAWERDGGCSRWLDFQVPGEAKVPSKCVNQSLFDTLEPGAAAPAD